MRRRTLLQTIGVAGTGLGVTSPAATHPTPTSDGSTDDGTPIDRSDGEPLGRLDLSAAHEVVASPDGHTAYVATGDGIAVVDIVDPTSPRLLAERTDLLADGDGGPIQRVQDLAVSGDRLLVVGPAHPSEGAHGLVVFDVADRREPESVAAYETDTTIHNCDFDGQYAFLTANGRDGNPLLLVDTTTETAVGTWSLLDADTRWADVPEGLWPLHDVRVQDGRAYLAYWDGGTWILDVSDPATPELVSKVRGRSPETLATVEESARERSEPPGNDHFVTVSDDATLLGVGGESWDLGGDDSGGPSGIELFDVADPTEPQSLTTIDPPETSDPTPGGVLTTAHNFELTDGLLYSAWYQGGVRVFDLDDPAAPEELYAWRDSESASFWTARRADGCFVATSTNANGGSDVQPRLYTFPNPAAEAATETGAGGDAASGATGDGFGVLAAVAAVSAAAWRLRTTRDD